MPKPVLWIAFLSAAFAGLAAAQEPGAVPKTVRLTGRVVTWQGKPVAEAAVAFEPFSTRPTAKLLAEPPAKTGADGRFELAVPEFADPKAVYAMRPTLLVAQKGMASLSVSVTFKNGPQLPDQEQKPRLDTDVGDLVLPEGVRLFGRVRDLNGKGIGGVDVVATDMLQSSRFLPGQASNFLCRAVTDDSGIFQLPFALPVAVTLSVSAQGFLRQTVSPVGVGTPLEIALQPGGRIVGRVLDEDGKGIEGATVYADYERRGAVTYGRTGPDGAFELPYEHKARYRVRANVTDSKPGEKQRRTRSTFSDLLDAVGANLELKLENPKQEVVKGERLVVQAVAQKDGAAVDGIRAAAIWQQHAVQNTNYFEYLVGMQMAEAKPAKGNEVEVPGPGDNDARSGVVRVTAKGFAPATMRDVEWKDLEPDTEGKLPVRTPIVVKMTPQSTIAGKVVDERTGAPIAGASVWAQPVQDPNQGVYNGGKPYGTEGTVKSGEDGSFLLQELGEGGWVVRFTHPERPTPPSITVELKTEENKTDVQLAMADGAVVAGKVTGMPVPTGTRVFLHPLSVPRFGASVFTSYSSSAQKPENTQPVAEDGSFEFRGVALSNFMLVVDVPSPPRCGGSLSIPIEPIRVRRDGVKRDFDGSADVPGRIEGKVTFARATPVDATLVVVAEQVGEDPNEQVFLNRSQFMGPRCFVGADGRFELGVSTGFHRLRLVDANTGLLLGSSADRVQVKSGAVATADVEATLAEIEIELVPENEQKPTALVDRLELRFTPKPDPKAQGRAMQVFGGNDNYDSGTGVDLPPGAKGIKVWLPEGSLVVLARNNVTQIRIDDDRYNVPAIAREELEIAIGETAPPKVTMKIGAPPEVPVKDEEKEKEMEAEEKARKK